MIVPTRWNRTYLACSLTAGLFACGGDGPFDSGLDDAKPAGTLTEEEVSQLCAATTERSRAYARDNWERICHFRAALSAGFAALSSRDPLAACEAELSTCPGMVEDLMPTCTAPPAGCEATVAELETCYQDGLDTFDVYLDVVDGLSCAEIVNPPESTMPVELEDPPSCVAVDTKCPGIAYGRIGD